MSDNSLYSTTDGESVPDNVADAFAAPSSDAWDSIHTSAIDAVRVGYVYGRPLYEGVRPDGREVLVERSGHAEPRSAFDYVTHVGDNYAVCMDTPFTYLSGLNHVHHDHRSEHITTVTVVFGDGERFRLRSRSGVVYKGHGPEVVSPRDAPERVRRVALAVSDTDAPAVHTSAESAEVPDIPDGMSRWSHATYRTDRPTATSERWNALVSGDLPPSWDTDSIVAFKNSDTRNVLHRELVAYANEAGRAALDSVFSSDEGSVTFP